MQKKRFIERGVAGISLLLAFTLAACATQTNPITPSSATPEAAATPIPYVENCAVVSIGSPSKFACNGKVYTAFELAKIREQVAKNLASSK
jgi:hypothetical protein